MVPVIAEHIEMTPGVCGGRPRIAGHRIRVQDVVLWHERMGMSPEEITVAHPGLTLSDVYAALAYYHDHRDEIRGFLAQEEAIVAALEAEQPSLLEKIVARQNAQGKAIASDLEAHLLSPSEKIMTRANAQNDPVPPG